jgi:hypothetical protein
LRIKGTISGVDYPTVRADGRFILNLYASIKTDDGENIAVYEDGTLLPPEDGGGIARSQLYMQLNTASSRYSWLNKVQAWGSPFPRPVSHEITVTVQVCDNSSFCLNYRSHKWIRGPITRLAAMLDSAPQP